jgi:hypothetical protein
MVSADRLAGVVSGGFILMILAVAGCQGQRAEGPATKVGADHGVAARGERPGSPEEVVRGRTTYEEPPEGGTPNESKRVPAEAAKAEPPGPAVKLTLKFVPGRAATYKLTSESYKSVEWKGAQDAKPAKFTDGRTGSHVELTFEQRVHQVQDDGSAVLEITIRGVKDVIESVNKVVLDFDSGKPTEADSPLAALVGKSYRVKMSPQGQVLEISNVEPARQAVQGVLPQHRVAARLLSDDEIRNRHEIAALSALKDHQVRPGQTWSSIKTFSFDDLGAKTYERVYTLRQVLGSQLSVPSSVASTVNRELSTANSPGRQALVEMKAIPSAARAEELYKQQTVSPFAGLSDNTDSYDGRLVLDLDRGQVREYVEQMQNEWVIADPGSLQTGQPAAIKMAARRLHRLEQVQ